MSNYHYFSDDEVTKWKLTGELWAGLDMARDKAGVPFIISNGLETPEQNQDIKGAVSDSAHLAGPDGLSKAVDLSTGGDHHVFNRMLYGLELAGLGDRMGLYFSIDPTDPKKLIPHHIHVDIDKTKPAQVTWFLMEQN
jgi:Peptidase M15